MATAPSEPSDEELLQAVESYLSGLGRSARLIVPGTATLTKHPLLDFRIVRRFEERRGGLERRVPGRKLKQMSKRPTYTDLATHPVDVPPGFARTPPVKRVLAGSVAEVPCGDCDGGTRACEGCRGSGTQDCVKTVTCDGCGGGSDACWSCGGTRNRGSRKPPANAQVRTDWCRRCGKHDVACPKCVGYGTMTCSVCDGKGHRSCDACKGSKRVQHKPCEGTGAFTTFTEAEITHPVRPHEERVRAPAHLWWPTRWRADWRKQHLNKVTDKLPADLPDPLRAQIEPQLPLAAREVARQATLRYLPLARVTVDADPNRVYFAFPDRSETGAIEVVRRPSRPRVVRLTSIASAAVAVAVLVTVLALTTLG